MVLCRVVNSGLPHDQPLFRWPPTNTVTRHMLYNPRRAKNSAHVNIGGGQDALWCHEVMSMKLMECVHDWRASSTTFVELATIVWKSWGEVIKTAGMVQFYSQESMITSQTCKPNLGSETCSRKLAEFKKCKVTVYKLVNTRPNILWSRLYNRMLDRYDTPPYYLQWL